MQIIYNVTVKIESNYMEDWLSWMKTIHIPEVMETGHFTSYKLVKILGDDDEYGVTFATQYYTSDIAEFEKYQANHAKRLQKDHSDRYAEKYVAFRTLMQVEQEG